MLRDHAFPSPFDQAKLQLTRDFLRREFRGCEIRDYFAIYGNAFQIFIVDVSPSLRHTLLIPEETFLDEDFARLLDVHLVTTLTLARDAPVTLMSRGAWY
jgi:hypothetical protein